MEPISVYVPKKGRESALLPTGNFIQKLIYPSGIFFYSAGARYQYVIVPIGFAREIFELPDKVSAIELKLKKGISEKKTIATISSLLGNNYEIKNRYQQHAYLYKTMLGEKYATYLILILILLLRPLTSSVLSPCDPRQERGHCHPAKYGGRQKHYTEHLSFRGVAHLIFWRHHWHPGRTCHLSGPDLLWSGKTFRKSLFFYHRRLPHDNCLNRCSVDRDLGLSDRFFSSLVSCTVYIEEVVQ